MFRWAAENFKDCQGCDSDGSVTVSVTNNEDRKVYRVPCPVMEKNCIHGRRLIEQLDGVALNAIADDIPALFRRVLKDCRWDYTEVLRRAALWDFRGIMYLYGPTGTGKSFAAAWTLWNRMRQRVEEVWSTPWLWSEQTRFGLTWLSAYRIGDDREARKEAIRASLLVIDDLGEEVRTPSTRAAIAEVISERYNSVRATVITSNIPIEKLGDVYSVRMTERIVNKSHAVPCYGENLRMNDD